MNRRTFQPVRAIYVKAKWCEDKRVIKRNSGLMKCRIRDGAMMLKKNGEGR